jgi:hypothetical protein
MDYAALRASAGLAQDVSETCKIHDAHCHFPYKMNGQGHVYLPNLVTYRFQS